MEDRIPHTLPGRLTRLFVVAVIGFLLLPPVVVSIAAFNDKALLSFPPERLSLRGHSPTTISATDSRTG